MTDPQHQTVLGAAPSPAHVYSRCPCGHEGWTVINCSRCARPVGMGLETKPDPRVKERVADQRLTAKTVVDHEGPNVSRHADGFHGDTPNLIRSIDALLALDDAGALVPHRLPGHARTLLKAAAARLADGVKESGNG